MDSRKLRSEIALSSGGGFSGGGTTIIRESVDLDAVWRAISLTNKIDKLSGVILRDVTFEGTVSGLSDSLIPDSITASNYLPLAGGALTGDLTIDTDVFVVDTTNDRVGIGTTSQSYKLSVEGAFYQGMGTTSLGFIAETQGPTPGSSYNGARAVFVSGKYAYMANESRDSFAVIDISNPASPTFLAETQGPTPSTSLNGASSVFVSGKYAYVTNFNNDSIAVIDISNPVSPTFIAETVNGGEKMHRHGGIRMHHVA